MARPGKRLRENVPGDFYVDSSCIDCDTCRQIAPETFARSESEQASFVHCQPRDERALLRAGMALVACPTSSIGSLDGSDVRAAARAFPELIEDDVFYCGYTSEKSFGASSYFIRRPEGNVLMDSPRAAGPLLERIRELGGVSLMVLSHRDDVADHERFHAEFGCERILHRADVGTDTRKIERPIDGREPVRLAPDLLLIPTPGHTRGSVCLLYKEKFLFTGDHLSWDRDGRRLDAMRGVCWYSADEQTRSMEALLDYRFEWILPGHGDRWRADSPEHMHRELEQLVSELRAEV
jgi:glyoxylase-like metal-dependent hydrolase (beta-lactamase superfamily II)/ferredoxin